MEDLRELYQEVILDHNNDPRNFRKIDFATHDAKGYNPLCGDEVHLYLVVKEGRIEDICFQGHGCAISKAAASLMTDALKSKTVEEAESLFHRFQEMVTQKPGMEINFEGLGKLAVFAGVREFPVRVKCATLVWHALEASLKKKDRATSE
ncbi:MAG: SUF system NifU family Fe-S cluster assembly protein [Candidatus Cloacimonetes bacterium 4572_55]|nr:MAG: SUF system NifU family Fe-S cluster assembly protein [Candidatus Cloacimonetes bacterium 4572_55]